MNFKKNIKGPKIEPCDISNEMYTNQSVHVRKLMLDQKKRYQKNVIISVDLTINEELKKLSSNSYDFFFIIISSALTRINIFVKLQSYFFLTMYSLA